MVDDHSVDVPPARHMLVVRNDDRPGVIGRVGTIIGIDAGINIADMDVGASPNGDSALMVVATTTPVPADVVARVRAAEGVVAVSVFSMR